VNEQELPDVQPQAASPAPAQTGPQSGLGRHVPDSHQVMSGQDVARATRRIAHEVVERNHGLDGVVLIGLQRGGVWLSEALSAALTEIEPDSHVPTGSIDVSFHRDDISLRPQMVAGVSDIPADLTGRTVVLVDDVLFTGRTVRAALDALAGWGRPRMVQLAVMVDRGHRELPIRADFVGKNLPTSRDERVSATLDGVVITKGGASS
jgi:pyrimidine operon attenuation protein / uracil phosphoribosyltransferase